MPDGTEIKAIQAHGQSYWSRTVEIQTTLHGEPVSYFAKVCAYTVLPAFYETVHLM